MTRGTPTCTSSPERGSDERQGKDSPAWDRIGYTPDRTQGVRMSTDTKLSALSGRQLFALRRRLASGVHDPALTLRGALHHDLRRCSSENCRCRSGELHGPYAYLTVYGDGRSRTVYVPQALAAITSEQVEATRPGEALRW